VTIGTHLARGLVARLVAMASTPTMLVIGLIGVGGLGAACGGDKASECELGATAQGLEVQDRKIVGLAAPYVADLGLAARDAELAGSIAARREVAWQIALRVLAPVPLADPHLADNFGGVQPVIPAWHTWYGRDDFERVFKKLYIDLGPAGRAVRAPFDDPTIAAALDWNTHVVETLSTWPEQRYLDYLAAIDEAQEPEGIAGISRVSYSPSTLRHLLGSYATTLACRLSPEPPAYATDPVRAGQDVVATEAVELAGCEWKQLGPFVVADGGALEVELTGIGDADLYVRRGAAPDAETFDCKSDGGGATETCVVDGGGPVYVALLGFGDGATATATVRYREADVRDPACLDGELPVDAVVVKADWRRADFGATLARYDTSGTRMATRLRPDGTADWGPGDGETDPQAADIYTVTLPNGATYRLAGLHIMTKELTHWVWITLWWSDQADTDFGQDRPAAIADLPGPWRNYKLCVATTYLEGDADPRGGFTGSLGDALAAVNTGGAGAPTWCSNPYIELGAGNAATNCIGCHQHGGTAITAEDILSDEARFPHHGRTRVRNNFFTDYSWALQGGRGDDLGSIIQAEVEYWDASDP
jgi:hypothetical protein